MICSHGVLTPLPDVWEMTPSTRRLFLPTIGANTSHRQVPTYVEEVRENFKEAYAEAQHQSNSEENQQKCNYDKATSTVQLMLGNTVLKKADAFQGKRKVKDWWSKVA